MKNLFALGCCLLLLGACAAAPVAVQYYLLNPAPPSGNSLLVPEPGQKILVLEAVELSSYLRQSGLLMQTRSNQLLVSSSHLWAERLDVAVPRALLQDLQRGSGDYAFYLQSSDRVGAGDYRLRLRLDNLHATEFGQVVASGRYQIIDPALSRPALTRDFSLQRDLDKDGYAEAVRQMQGLIGRIAEWVLQDMAAVSRSH